MGIGFSSASLIFSLMFFALFLMFSSFRYKHKFGVSYNVSNMFPFELNYKVTIKETFYSNICLFLAFISGAAFYLTFSTPLNGIEIVPAIAGAVAFLLMAALAFVPTSRLTAHLLVFVFFGLTTLISSISTSIISFNFFKETDKNSCLIPFSLSLLIFLVLVVLLMNPKMTFRQTLKESRDENGKRIYVRPKCIVIAFTEWLLNLLLYLNCISLLIFVFIRQ